MPRTERLTAIRAFGLEEVVKGRHVVRIAVGPRFDPIILSLDFPPDYRKTTPSGASFAKLQAVHTNHYRIDHIRN
jgi:hypothetical protein